jgi:hypothetical protein
MGKQLVQWFLFCVLVGIGIAYLTGRALGPEASYLSVFRFVGTGAFYAPRPGPGGRIHLDGARLEHNPEERLRRAPLCARTAGTFGWLWPR